MRVALLGVMDPLATSLSASLAARHQVMALADSSDRDACAAAASCDVVVQGYPTGDAVAAVDRATRGTWNVLTTTRASRFVQLSSMRVFDGYPEGWAIDEGWIPRLNPDPASLAPYLGELTAREMSRTRSVECVAVPLDWIVAADVFEAGPVGPDWLHIDDAVSAITAVVQAETLPGPSGHWRPIHIVRGDGSRGVDCEVAVIPSGPHEPGCLQPRPPAAVAHSARSAGEPSCNRTGDDRWCGWTVGCSHGERAVGPAPAAVD